MADPPGPYRVVCAGQALQQVRAWLQKAAELGWEDRHRAALATIQEKLTTDPMAWGDPLFRLRHLGLLRCRGSAQPFLVEYAVDEPSRIVYVLDIHLFPPGGS